MFFYRREKNMTDAFLNQTYHTAISIKINVWKNKYYKIFV